MSGPDFSCWDWSPARTGALLLLDLGLANLVAAGEWLVAGVALHDGVLAPLTVLVCAVGVAVVPQRFRAPVASGLIVLGTATISAIPVLGRFGARPDKATLMDRNYLAGWLILAIAVLVGVGIGCVIAQRRCLR